MDIENGLPMQPRILIVDDSSPNRWDLHILYVEVLEYPGICN